MSTVFSEAYSNLYRTVTPFLAGASRTYLDLVQMQVKQHYGLTALGVLLDSIYVDPQADLWYLADNSEIALTDLVQRIFSIGLMNAGADTCDWINEVDEDDVVIIDTQRDGTGEFIPEEEETLACAAS